MSVWVNVLPAREKAIFEIFSGLVPLLISRTHGLSAEVGALVAEVDPHRRERDGIAFAVPVSEMDCDGLARLSSTSVTAPLRVPGAVGVNVTLIAPLWQEVRIEGRRLRE